MLFVYAAAATLVMSLAGWIAYAIAAFFVLAPFAAGFGFSERTADIVLGIVLLPAPVILSIWVFRRVVRVERARLAAQAADTPPPATAEEKA